MSKQVKRLDRVIIRFAGDSGDGMQLTGDRFTQESASSATTSSTLPNFPAEIRAPQGTLPGVSSFQVHFADHDILTPGDAPDVLVAMNPAALRANLGDLPKGATIVVDTHDFTARNLTKAGLHRQPARGRQPRRVRRPPGRPDRHDRRGGQGSSACPQGRRPRPRTCSPSGCCPGSTRGPPSRRSRSCRSASRRCPDIRDANVDGVPRGLELRRDHRDVRGLLRDQARPDADRHLPQHHRQPRPVLRADRGQRAVRAADLPRLLPDHAGLRHPARAQQAQGLRRHDVPGRGRDRRHRRGHRRVVLREPRRHRRRRVRASR